MPVYPGALTVPAYFDMQVLLGRRSEHQLWIWNIHGRLDAFTADLLAK